MRKKMLSNSVFLVSLNADEDPDLDDCREVERLLELNRRSGPCDDDYEATSPFVDMLPDESEHEHGSPLNFGKTYLTLD